MMKKITLILLVLTFLVGCEEIIENTEEIKTADNYNETLLTNSTEPILNISNEEILIQNETIIEENVYPVIEEIKTFDVD